MKIETVVHLAEAIKQLEITNDDDHPRGDEGPTTQDIIIFSIANAVATELNIEPNDAMKYIEDTYESYLRDNNFESPY